MKRFFFLIAVFAFSVQVIHSQTKRALIIAIGNYPNPEKNLWPEISSEHDVPLIQTALEKQNFPKSNIWTCIDAQATKDGILKALDKLIDSSHSGDIVVIHVSSHGEQIEDDNVDEEADGLDECIVPYGAVYSPNKTVFSRYSNGYLRDDDFGERITRLRNKLGMNGDVLVTLDACHSGSGTRGVNTHKSRGSNAPMVSPDFDKKKVALKDNNGVFKEKNTTELKKDAATYVVISGAQAQEKNYECNDDDGNNVGSLSYALSKALTTLDGKITYRTLFAQVEDVMREKAPQQKPVLEGDGIDRELFGGRYLKQKAYLPIDLPHSNSDTIFVNAGTVAGVTLGSEIGFYPSGTADPNGAQQLEKGEVVIATNFTAAIKLSKPHDEFLTKAPWAFVTEMSYGNKPITINIDSLDAGTAQKLKEGLKDYKSAVFTSDGELYLGKAESGRGYALRYAYDGSLFYDTVKVNNPDAFKNALKRYDQYRYLRDLKFSEQGLSADVQLVFLNAKKKIDYEKIRSRTKFGRLELQEGDTVYLNVKNTGTKKLYVNIVDLQPDGLINRVLPNRLLKDVKGLPRPITPEQCMINPRDSILNTDMMIHIAPPYGSEIFKVFLSTQQLDLEDMLAGVGDQTSRNSRGILNNLAKVFESSENKTGSRGVNPLVGAQDGTIFSYNFNIVERKE